MLATRKVDLARLGALLPDLALAVGNVAGQTYAQLIKRPEISVEGLLPVLRPEMAGTGDPVGFFSGAVNAASTINSDWPRFSVFVAVTCSVSHPVCECAHTHLPSLAPLRKPAVLISNATSFLANDSMAGR